MWNVALVHLPTAETRLNYALQFGWRRRSRRRVETDESCCTRVQRVLVGSHEMLLATANTLEINYMSFVKQIIGTTNVVYIYAVSLASIVKIVVHRNSAQQVNIILPFFSLSFTTHNHFWCVCVFFCHSGNFVAWRSKCTVFIIRGCGILFVIVASVVVLSVGVDRAPYENTPKKM